MQRLLQAIPICTLLSRTGALSVPPLFSISQNTTTHYSPSTNQTVLGYPFCSDYHYGHGLNLRSCENAWAKIQQSVFPQRFRKRTQGTAETIKPPDMALPARYLSDDGTCAIDVTSVHQSGRDVRADTTTGVQIAGVARLILDKCVRDAGSGGSVVGIGAETSLAITIASYEPYVDCEPRPSVAPTEASCSQVLSNMPAQRITTRFSASTHSIKGVTKLPRFFRSDDHDCRILVTMAPDQPPEKARWFDIWAAGVALNTMCVQHGFTGIVKQLGDDDQISISLTSARINADDHISNNLTSPSVSSE